MMTFSKSGGSAFFNAAYRREVYLAVRLNCHVVAGTYSCDDQGAAGEYGVPGGGAAVGGMAQEPTAWLPPAAHRQAGAPSEDTRPTACAERCHAAF